MLKDWKDWTGGTDGQGQGKRDRLLDGAIFFQKTGQPKHSAFRIE